MSIKPHFCLQPYINGGLCPFVKWVSKNIKILNRSMSIRGSKKEGEVPRVFKFG